MNKPSTSSMHSATGTALDSALAETTARYRARNPGSERLLRKAADVLPAGNTRSVLFYTPFPLYMARGEGCHLWDADGHRYLDALGEFTAGIYGHSNPVIRQAIVAALQDGLSLSSHTAREAALAHEIQRRFPGMALLRFTNSGTEANLMALAAATAHTGRRKVLVFNGAYHGGVLSFGGGGSPVNVPHDFVVAPYNDLDAVRGLVQTHGPQLAAILVEPMLGAGGCIPAEPAFLHGLRALADACGALLILDEVMTSRLSGGGRQALLGLKPDLTTLGKYFGGGLSFGAFGGRVDVMSRFDPRRADALGHAGTFNNNTLTMAAGLAGLTQVLTPAALDALNQRGERLRERLNGVFKRHAVGLQFTGLGSVMQLHATDRPLRNAADLAGADDRVKALLFFDLLERGIFLARRGLVALSLPFGDAEADEFVAALDAVVTARHALLPVAG
ncbi:aspartate aminotransferase family protein [Polaromonas sp. JS666]|uniref:aspartate aminotransferase family protein n=1 Tax=Polaromonas sp. (strain JS666 / ATCC BAA-500) TaxID=296591 RepID=UPI0000464BFB|nr:aminotransferase class III-fold pyridoxal phosphate-dependent enzyme [Polaromonas sp. JS666]ABE43415.1 glutamate-1-semialdehyde 2,1-aminomutase [Polaromonas sp. JS666]